MSSKNFQTKLLSLQGNLLNFAYLLTSNRDDAYDLLQDTTLKALDNEDKYVENVNFKGWVFTIMRNIFINNYRKVVRSATIIDQTEDLYHLNCRRNLGLTLPKVRLQPVRLQMPSIRSRTITAFRSPCTWPGTSITK